MRRLAWAFAVALAALIAARSLMTLGGEAQSGAEAPARSSLPSRAAAAQGELKAANPPLRVARASRTFVAGVVQDEPSLGPIVGAVICLERTGGRFLPICETTDGAGRFDFGALEGAPQLMVSAMGYSSKRGITASGNVRVVLARADQAIVSGTVIDGTGGRVAGAMVVARARAGDGEPLATALTDDGGRFQLNARAGELRLIASFESYATAEVLTQAPIAGVQMSLFPGTPLGGRVIDEDTGAPVVGVLVAARNDIDVGVPMAPVTTNDDGSFSFDSLGPGSYQLTVTSEQWTGAPVPVEIDIGGSVDPALLKVNAAGVLDVTIDLGGIPCQSGHVDVAAATLTAPVSAGQGRLGGMLPGTYAISIHCDGGISIEDDLTIGRGLMARGWSLDTGLALRGSVHRASGEPIAGAAIIVERISDSAGQPALVPPLCLSDGGGRFRCSGLVAGTYQCRLLERGSSDARVVSLAAGAPEPDLKFTAAARGTIRARLDGPILHGAQLVARLETSHWLVPGHYQNDAFVFDQIPLGRYIVSWNVDVAEPASFAIANLDQDGQAVEVNVPASSSNRVISGRVVDRDGFPIEGAWVRAHVTAASWGPPGEPGSPVLSNAEGAFAIEGLLPGRYDVAVTTRTTALVQRNVPADRSDLTVVMIDDADRSEDD